MASAEQEADVWYFAIGSMINPTSLAARGLKPKQSEPAELIDHRLLWKGSEGMASQEAAPGESFHGVLHLMSAEHMKKLDAIELSYDQVKVNARLYNGSMKECVVYKMNLEALKKSGMNPNAASNLPQQRYIDIIVEGCKHFGVDQKYIDWLKEQPCRPRTKPEDYLRFDVPEGVPQMTMEEVMAGDGVDDRPIYRTANKKVLKYVGPHEGFMWDRVKDLKPGQTGDVLVDFSQLTYDPLFGAASSRADMTPEHFAYREDMYMSMVGKFAGSDIAKLWSVVGLLP